MHSLPDLVLYTVITTNHTCSLWLITSFVTRITRSVPLAKQEMYILPEYLSTTQVFIGVDIAQSVVFCLVFCRSLFFLLFFFYWSLYCQSFFDLRLLITLWYLQSSITFHQFKNTLVTFYNLIAIFFLLSHNVGCRE
jgi:hypothetical protein